MSESSPSPNAWDSSPSPTRLGLESESKDSSPHLWMSDAPEVTYVEMTGFTDQVDLTCKRHVRIEDWL